MSGQSGIRGYLIQTIITVLNSLADDEWNSIIVEPDIGNDKVDILWEYSDRQKVSQVKSSQNQITLGMATGWCQELEANVPEANEYELLLIGPINKDITTNPKIGEVSIPIPQPLNVNSLINQASNELDKFLESNSVSKIPVFARELKPQIEKKIGLEVNILNPVELGAKARTCHNKLVLTCDSKEVIDLFRYIVIPFDGKPPVTMDIIVDLREAIRREIGFGNISVDTNRDLSWIGTI